MGVYGDRVLPRLVDLTLRGDAVEELRRDATAALRGEVLEVGFGSGRNVPHYPADVVRVRAVDPSGLGRKLAAGRVEASPVPIDDVGPDGEHLPLDDASVDHVLSTWTLCTIPDVGAALAEVRRVLRPGGALHFVEHGRSPDAAVARWQERLDPLQRRLVGGCHLTRRIDELIKASGLEITQLGNQYLRGPRVFGYLYLGAAIRAPSR
jgi:ubiquinone/menaquinone biosynthesis C-methylase UbiE